MWAKLESLANYENMKNTFDVIVLIKSIKELTCQFEGQRYHTQALHHARTRLYLLHQAKGMSNVKYLENFKTLLSLIEQYGGAIGHDPGKIKTELSEMNLTPEIATDEQLETATKVAKEKYLAVTMVTTADKSRYTKLCEELENDFTKGNNNWPVAVTEAYNLLVNYKQPRPSGRIFNNSRGAAFTTVDKGTTPMSARRKKRKAR
jgi:hypothetical protein